VSDRSEATIYETIKQNETYILLLWEDPVGREDQEDSVR
jgi:hypothetical protein